MRYFSVPADFKRETIDQYARLNTLYPEKKVVETYGQLTDADILGSGRLLDRVPPVNISQLKKYIDYSRKQGIGFNYTLNAACLGNTELIKEGITGIKCFLRELHEAGVRSLTVALPALIELIREIPLDFEIKASAIMGVTNAAKAALLKNMGVHRLVADESVNRHFDALNRIRRTFGENTEIIINSFCHKNCAFRMFHYNQIAHESSDRFNRISSQYYANRCIMRRFEKPGNFLRLTWIRPEDLHYYAETGIRYFKLRGRQQVVKGDPVRTIEYYFKESFDGNLMELIDLFSPTSSFIVYIDNKKMNGFLERFYRHPGFCKDDCDYCRECDIFASKVIDKQQVEDILKPGIEFYRQLDEFSQDIKVDVPLDTLGKNDPRFDFT